MRNGHKENNYFLCKVAVCVVMYGDMYKDKNKFTVISAFTTIGKRPD